MIHKPVVKSVKSDALPRVSIIIAAYNEARHIEKKIVNCLSLEYPADKMEIIIGSDGSDDGTNDIIEKYVSRGILFFPHQARRGKMAVVNDGVESATGDICIFTDVSELFDRNAVLKLVRNFKDKEIGAVTGNHIYNRSDSELGKGTSLYWKYQRFIQKCESRVATILSCDGTIYACRRRLYRSPPLGTINDDKAVPLGIVKQGYRIVFEPEAVARGDVLERTLSFYNQKVRSQAGMYQLFWVFKDMFRFKNRIVWFIFMSHTVGPVAVPWMILLIFLSNLYLLYLPFYSSVFVFQVGFYLLALAGASAQKRTTKFPLLYIPYYFTIANIGSLNGFLAYLRNNQAATWTKVE
ncbi:MAG: glycosyltransferase family 2 protein [Desulfobacteraceae bacterium]|nr:glycosyltransferase family 2 protein [Desulfobacteraceae bacterium]